MSHLIPLQQHLTRLGVCCGASWKTTLKEAAARLGALEKTGDVDWERGLSLGLEIRRMFGGMCTLNDLPFDEIGLQRKADLRDSLDLWLMVAVRYRHLSAKSRTRSSASKRMISMRCRCIIFAHNLRIELSDMKPLPMNDFSWAAI
jgi:hypothetical protein